ncbi:MAG: DUF6605 domain-containing protein [Thermoleophilia bacterium]
MLARRQVAAGVVALVLAAVAAGPAAAGAGPQPPAPAATGAPALLGLRVTNGGPPFAGDRRLLATISPNGDGFRDRAVVTFRLKRPARVTLQAFTTRKTLESVVHEQVVRLGAGRHTLRWRPPATLEPRTYVLALTVRDARGRVRQYGCAQPVPCLVQPAPVVRVQGVDAAFTRQSYAPGEQAELSIATDARAVTITLLHAGPEEETTTRNDVLLGVPVSDPATISWRGKRNAPQRVRIGIGDWPSGLYAARIEAADGRVGFAPFVVRPAVLGQASRVAVVLPTDTWQAYNFQDADGDGWGDTWYASGRQRTVDLTRPHLTRGVPFRYRLYDLPFLRWLDRRGKVVDVLADEDIARFRDGDTLARTYDLIVFPGHSEYVTTRAYDLVERYRDLGGNLMFLSSNSFFWRVDRRGQTVTRVRRWRDLGRPEAALIGVQYRANDDGSLQDAYVVVGADAAPWLFEGTTLTNGRRFGNYGIEIDQRTADSPDGTILLATIPNLLGPGLGPEMTYYETQAGARVFAAGVLAWAGSARLFSVGTMLENLWARLGTP